MNAHRHEAEGGEERAATARPRRDPRPRRAPRRDAHEEARPELRARRQHGAPHRAGGRGAARRDRARDRAGARLAHARAAGGRGIRHRGRDRQAPGRAAAAHRAPDAAGHDAHGRDRRRAARHRAARRARAARREPALQRVGARAAAPARALPVAHVGHRHGAGRGRAPPRGRARLEGLRRAERQGGLVRRWRTAGQVSRMVFWPVPNVDSVLVGVRPRRTQPGTEEERVATFALVDAAFQQRRKMLRQALSGVLGGTGGGRSRPSTGPASTRRRAASSCSVEDFLPSRARTRIASSAPAARPDRSVPHGNTLGADRRGRGRIPGGRR